MINKTQESKGYRFTLLDIATILYHVHRGAQMPDRVGFEDCNKTLNQLTRDLSPRRALIFGDTVESALWSCNLMDETGEWWSPMGETFDQFVKRALKYARPDEKLMFNKFYNYIQSDKNKSKKSSQEDT